MVSTAASDPYTLSIIAYALARAQSSKVGTVLGMLEALAKVEGNIPFSVLSITYYFPAQLLLLCYISCLHILRWLIKNLKMYFQVCMK